ncbi:MAG TPA: serine hydrolase domain-containing protein, partial [Propionibacteriaceae bacterium]|nr:serine hydrolase domain-containing protein [Propionibacteriaceae bacterium]
LIGVILWAAASGPRPAHADPAAAPTAATVQRVVDYLDHTVAANGWPGAALAVVSGQSIVALHATGEADGSGRALTPQTPVLLASLTKSITATAIMQLVESGSVDVDSPVISYLPWFTTRDRARSDTMTVAQLLHHTSGLPAHTVGEHERLQHGEPSDLERGVRDLSGSGLVAAPGASFLYSNANYNVLGMIVEVVSGLPFGEYVQRHIFTPARMTSSFIGKDQATQHAAAVGYRPWFGGPFRPTDVPVPGSAAPSAGGYASAADLARYLILQLNAGEVDGTTIVSPGSLARIHQPAVAANDVTGYAMGWFVRPGWEYLRPAEQTTKGRLPLLVEHEGSWSNTTTYLGFLPEAKIGVVVLINAGAPDRSQLAATGANIWRLLASQAPTAVGYPGPWLEVNGWRLAVATDVVLLVSAATAVMVLRRSIRGRRRAFAVGALAVDVVVAIFVLAYVPRAVETPLLAIAQYSPDVGIAIGVALLLTLVWGPVRTVLLMRGSPP